jgi:hypothetical protein
MRVPSCEGIGTPALASLPNPRFSLQSHPPSLPSPALGIPEYHKYVQLRKRHSIGEAAEADEDLLVCGMDEFSKAVL